MYCRHVKISKLAAFQLLRILFFSQMFIYIRFILVRRVYVCVFFLSYFMCCASFLIFAFIFIYS